MTVEQLIYILKRFEPEAPVSVTVNCATDYSVHDITDVRWTRGEDRKMTGDVTIDVWTD